MLFGGFLWIALWGVLIYFIVKASTTTRDPQSMSRLEDTALEILRRRYAEGAITKDEFDELRRDLMDSAA